MERLLTGAWTHDLAPLSPAKATWLENRATVDGCMSGRMEAPAQVCLVLNYRRPAGSGARRCVGVPRAKRVKGSAQLETCAPCGVIGGAGGSRRARAASADVASGRRGRDLDAAPGLEKIDIRVAPATATRDALRTGELRAVCAGRWHRGGANVVVEGPFANVSSQVTVLPATIARRRLRTYKQDVRCGARRQGVPQAVVRSVARGDRRGHRRGGPRVFALLGATSSCKVPLGLGRQESAIPDAKSIGVVPTDVIDRAELVRSRH